jgi:hypothetical protein
VLGGFNWGNPPLPKPAPAAKEEDDEDDKADQPKPQPAPRQRVAQGFQAAPAGPNMFQEHAAAQQAMIASTNAAWANELQSRSQQAQDERNRQHEYEMEMLRQQGASQRAQQQPAGGGDNSPPDAARQARNRSLLAAAGLGGRTSRHVGGRREVIPHQFGNNPFARSLLG